MNFNPLDHATRSLRQQTESIDPSPSESEAGLHRVLRDVRAGARRRKTIRVIALQLCAVCIGFGAWAAGTGRLTQLSQIIGLPQVQTHAKSPLKPRTSAPPSAVTVDVTVGLGVQPAVSPSPNEIPPVHQADRMVPVRAFPKRTPLNRVPVAAIDQAVAPPIMPPTVDALSEYQAAYHMQFVEKNLERAVEMWSQYLQLGDIVLSVDARFNRAVALARLIRTNDASSELTPFANGEYGGYRQNEAKRILRWLSSRRDQQ